MSNIYLIDAFLEYLHTLLEVGETEVNIGIVAEKAIHLSIADAITLITELKNEGYHKFLFNLYSLTPLIVSACPVTDDDGSLTEISQAQLN